MQKDIDYPLILQEIRAELRIIQLAERSDATPALRRFLPAQAAFLKVESYHAADGRGGRAWSAKSRCGFRTLLIRVLVVGALSSFQYQMVMNKR
jgi:hypothetical protein